MIDEIKNIFDELEKEKSQNQKEMEKNKDLLNSKEAIETTYEAMKWRAMTENISADSNLSAQEINVLEDMSKLEIKEVVDINKTQKEATEESPFSINDSRSSNDLSMSK